MKIIDTHVHCGKADTFDIQLNEVIRLTKRYNISISIISNLENGEKYHKQIKQDSIYLNDKTLQSIQSIDNFYMLYWIRPKLENMNKQIEQLILQNRNKILGLKIHPYLSDIRIDHKKMQPYLEFANEHSLPVAVHTATGYGCETDYLAKVCKKYTNTNFIAVHMDLGTDHQKAVKYVNTIPNLYGDISWITYQDYVKLDINPDKVLFGSDVLVNKETAYGFYDDYFNNKENQTKLMHENAQKIFFKEQT